MAIQQAQDHDMRGPLSFILREITESKLQCSRRPLRQSAPQRANKRHEGSFVGHLLSIPSISACESLEDGQHISWLGRQTNPQVTHQCLKANKPHSSNMKLTILAFIALFVAIASAATTPESDGELESSTRDIGLANRFVFDSTCS